jgi:hypothetical protein
MQYAAVKCKTCGELGAAFEIPTGPKVASWIRPSWEDDLTCPTCGANHHYIRSELEIYEGNIAPPLM